jgi:WD40 repeat protein/serine/threonine protein kinase
MGDFEERTQEMGSDPETLANESVDLQVYGQDTVRAGFADQRIGRYRLIRPIGQGGMGVVWLASQEKPVKREVALKLVGSNVGVDAIARFEAERQAIAMMDHPNIAKIFDAGTTEEGNPYFVMELVKGIPFDQYCNNQKLGIEERLRLMIPVCRAVQHAHQKAIIHRDLKHSNILLADDGENPIPKVIDFGLAKALGSQKTLTDKTVYTEYGKVVGTIHYMSPEQADSDGIDIDTRSDIYSLGVILYKLLTGMTPLQVGTDGISVISALTAIRQQDAAAPSTVVRQDEDCVKWIQKNTPGSRFVDGVRGDLDSIVLKALEKDRRKRYETASGLALDIERFLNHEPVLAQPRNTMYAIRKFVQRNRRLVATIATIIGLLIAGIVGTSSALMYALSETERANQTTAFAKQEAERAKLAELRAKDAERLTRTQLRAQLHKSAASDWQNGNCQNAWQTLRQVEPQQRRWISRHLANEMSTCCPADTFNGHAHYVLSVDISPDGNLFLSGGADDALRLWDAKSGKEIHRCLFEELVACVRFSPDGKTFAAADRSNVVSLFETSTRELLKTYGPFEEDVSSIAFHPGGSILALGLLGNDSKRKENNRIDLFDETRPPDLLLIDMQSGATLQALKGHTKEITSLDFDSRGSQMVSACMDGKVRHWKSEATRVDDTSKSMFRLERTIDAHFDGVYAVDFSEDGSFFVSAGEDKIAILWDAQSGMPKAQFAGHSSAVLAVDISSCGKRIATASEDNTAAIWDREGKKLVVWQGHAAPINSVKFTVDGESIITASDDQTLRRWKAAPSGTTSSCPVYEDEEVWQADFSPDKSMVAVASEGEAAILIDAKTGEILGELPHDGAVLALDWLEDGRLITAGDGFGIWVWNISKRTDVATAAPTVAAVLPKVMIWDISTSSDEEQLLVSGSDDIARVFETKSFSETGTLEGHTDVVACARFSPDGRHIVTSSDDGTVRLWDAESRKQIHSFEEHARPVWRAVFSPKNPNLIASSAVNGDIFLWDTKAKERLPITFKGHTAAVAGLTFADDGRSLVSACDDGTVRIWDVDTGVELFTFHHPSTRPMIHASFSEDGQSLVTGGVGFVEIRHASQTFSSPYLNRDATADSIRGDDRVISEDVSEEELRTIVKESKKVIQHYPSFEAWSNLGIAQYKLGNHSAASESLSEAIRLEKILYNMSDLRPWIEGFYALAAAKSGDPEKAREMAELLDIEAEYWGDDPDFERLRAEVQAVIAE